MSGGREWWDWEAVFEGGGERFELRGSTDAPAGSTGLGIKNGVAEDAPKRNPRLRGLRITQFRAEKRR